MSKALRGGKVTTLDDGAKARHAVGENVFKLGGYTGSGEIVATFRADDDSWRYVVAHEIADGEGRFYHIYVAKNFARKK